MSLLYRDVRGAEHPISGLNSKSGELVPSVSYYQKGGVTIPIGNAGDDVSVPITLGTAMPDADYVVDFSNHGTAVAMSYASKTKTGFSVQVRYFRAVANSYNATYQAFKLMTDESRAIDEQAIATNTADIATLKSSLTVTNGTGTRNASYVSSTGFRANWYKYGRIVTLSLQVTASAELAGTELLVTGLPAPITDLTFTGATSVGNANLNAVLTTAGALRPHYSWANGAAFMCTLTYISKE